MPLRIPFGFGRRRPMLAVLSVLAVLVLGSRPTAAVPRLEISLLGYQVTQIQAVPGNSRAYDVTSTAGVCGDAASGVSARLTSSSPAFVVLDGDVQFGAVPRASCLRPIISRDTFTLRVILPAPGSRSQLTAFVAALFNSLSWSLTCASCGTNRPPQANAGPDQTSHVGELVALDATGSSDPDGQPLSYAWTMVTRPPGSVVALVGAATVHPTFIPDREGQYEVQLVVSDGRLASAPDTVQVNTVNSPPVAHAGPDQTAYVGQAVSLDGTGSTDVDGDALTYAWTLVSRPAGSAAEITTNSQSTAGLVPDVPGEYVVHLVVQDGSVSSAADVVVVSTRNSRPVANAGQDQTVLTGAAVSLDGSGSSDVDADPLTFRWSLISFPAGSVATLTDPASHAPAFTVDRPGTYVAQLIVNDGTADSDADTVIISTRNSAPHADAGLAQTVRWNSDVTLDGTASSDADGSALSYAWSLLSRPDGSKAALQGAATPTPSFSADRPGAYVIQLIVNDGIVDSTPATVTITATNQPPVAADDSARATPGTPIDIDVLGNDGDADGDRLEIASVSPASHGTTAIASGGIRYRPDSGFNGTDSFTYVLSDGADSDTAIVTVVVSSNGSPIANDDLAVGLQEVALDVAVLANDTDPDGDSLSISSVSQPANGAVVINGGVVTFTPSEGFVGSTTFTYVVVDGRGGSASGGVTITVVPQRPPQRIARLELAPSALLLTTVNEPRTLEVRAFDENGATIPIIPYDQLRFVSSHDEQIPVSAGGSVEALTIPASAVIRVQLIADATVTSAPVLVAAADLSTREQVVVLADEEIVDDPFPVDVTDRRYDVRLTRALAAGTLVVNSGGKAVMGRVVSADPDAGDGTFRTEVRLVPLTTIFENLALAYSFTAEELSTEVQEEPQSRVVRTMAMSARPTALAANALPGGGACELEVTSPELTGSVTGTATPALAFDTDLAITRGVLERFHMIASGSLDASVSLTAAVNAAVGVEGKCKKKLATILVPIGGPLSLLIGARVPIGLKGSVELLVQQNLATLEVSQDVQATMALGIVYERSQGFLPVDELEISPSPISTNFDVPPSSLRLRGKASLSGTAGISLGVLGSGGPLFELVDLSAGPQFEARFGEPYDVSSDAEYSAGYELKLVGKAGPGGDITKVLEEIFGIVPPPLDVSLSIETLLGRSPRAGAVMKADRAAFVAGDDVTFRVDLDPSTATFPLLGYNVSEIRIYLRDEASATARLVASRVATPGDTTVELTWTADRDGRATNSTSGRDNFFAFVVPVLLSTIAEAYPLELGPVVGAAPIEIVPREVVLGTGGGRQFIARIEGQPTTNVHWTATGGTISATGFFQAGRTPGAYTVTVARADAPNVRDEATVEVRPRCIPGLNSYCGFAEAVEPWPGGTTWGASSVNDNGDWVGFLYDASQPRDTRHYPQVYFGRGDSYQLVSGLGSVAGFYFPRSLPIPDNSHSNFYLQLTNSNAFAGCYNTDVTTGAFVSQNGITRFLDPLPGDTRACAWDVSEDLVVVGFSEGPSGTRVVRWVNGVAEDLGLWSPWIYSLAISGDGRILVSSLSSGMIVWHDGVATTLAGGDCIGWDINSHGDVVGSCTSGSNFVWRNGVPLPLEGTARPYAINDNGDILGWSPEEFEVLWHNGVRHKLSERFGDSYVDGPPRFVTSISPTKSLLGGYGASCIGTGNDCRNYIWIGYPIELVVP